MNQSQGVELSIQRLTKRFNRQVLAVNDLSFSVMPGRVTGFLGPNGSGKSTTLRCLLGLVHATDGRALIGGQPYAELAHPGRVVGASLESNSFHPARSGRNHLRVIADAIGVANARVDECLAMVGLDAAAGRNVGGYSLGMRQRLGLATAMLGDPDVLVLDEPANGLDPEGIAWLRTLLRHLASEGRTVLVSSHLLTEVSNTVDDVVIINKGALVKAGPMSELIASPGVRVRSPRIAELSQIAQCSEGVACSTPDGDAIVVTGMSTAELGELAHAHSIPLHELTASGTDLERIFLELTS